jgi:hypothetical protein
VSAGGQTPRFMSRAREREGSLLRLQDAAIALSRAMATADYEVRKREVVRLSIAFGRLAVADEIGAA